MYSFNNAEQKHIAYFTVYNPVSRNLSM